MLALLVAVVGLTVTTAAAAPARDPYEHGHVRAGDATVHYVRTGSGPVLVLLHGWPQTWWEWHTVIPALSRRFTVLAFDLPGLGGSLPPPASGYDKATTANRIRRAVQALGYRQVGILANDIGSTVAFNYARDYPDEVTRMIVMEAPVPGFAPAGFAPGWHFGFNSQPAPIPERILDDDDVRVYLDMIFDASFVPGAINPADRKVYYRAYAKGPVRTAGYEYYRALPADAADNQRHAASKRLRMPVLALGAEHVFGPAVAASFRNVGDDVREGIVPDSGHWVPEENPSFLIACTTVFFGPRDAAVPSHLAACTP